MRSDYEKRKNEVEYFLKILEKLERVKLNDYEEFLDLNYNKFKNNDFFKILRSNFILILYNFIEASVFLFIGSIYEKFEDEEITYLGTSEIFQKLFIEHKFLDIFKKDSNFNTYKNKVNEIVKEISNNIILKFETSKLSNLFGNISSEKLREVCKSHGITLQSSSISQDSNNKFSVTNIKNERNSLAHGRESFLEVGSRYTVSNLKKYYEEIALLMDDMLDSVEKFIKEEKYKYNT